MTRIVKTLIPIRSFDGMTRLSGHLDTEDRRLIARDMAGRAVRAALAANTRVSVITADAEVQEWAIASNAAVINERRPRGLDAAATAGIETAGDDPWLVIHSDLPGIGPEDVHAAVQAVGRGCVLAPSHDGGTSLIGGGGPGFPFKYGPGSFRRHLAAINGVVTILIRPGLALDLDRPWDLATLTRLGYVERTADS
jgi:2-phospho-L-lactate guanylyltransferase